MCMLVRAVVNKHCIKVISEISKARGGLHTYLYSGVKSNKTLEYLDGSGMAQWHNENIYVPSVVHNVLASDVGSNIPTALGAGLGR